MATLFIGSGCFPGLPENTNQNTPVITDFIQYNVKANQNGTVTEIQMSKGVYGTNSRGPIKFKVWRENGLNYDFVGQTEPFLPLSHTLTSSDCYVLPVNSTIAIQSGDLFGYNISPQGTPDDEFQMLAAGTLAKKKSGDFTTTQLISGFSDFNIHIAAGFYGVVVVPPANQATSLVRAKNPDTGNVISFLTDYDYSTSGFQTIKSYRSLTGNLFVQQYNNFKRFEIPITQMGSKDINELRTWKADRLRIRFTENHSDTNVDSGFFVVVTELNINKFKTPYSQKLWKGNLVLETV